MGGVRLLLSRWRADRGLLALLVAVVTLTAGLVGAVPGLLTDLARASLGDAVDRTTVDRAGLAAASIRPFSASSPQDAAERLGAIATGLEQELPPELADVLQPPTTVVDSIRYDLGPLPGEEAGPFARKLTARLDPSLGDELEVTEGRLPDGEVGTVALDLGEVDADGAPVATELPVHEVAVTAATAEALGVQVGDRRLATADQGGPILLRLPLPPTTAIVLEVAGLVELTAPEDPVWFGERGLHRPATFSDSNGSTTVFATGLVPLAAAAEFPGARSAQPAATEVRWRLDVGALLGSTPSEVEAAARSLRSTAVLQLTDPRWRTGLDRLLATEAARRATAVEMLGLGAVAVLGVALVLLVAVAALMARRRRGTLALVRGRGTSRLQLLGAAVLELGVVCAVGVVLAVVGLQATTGVVAIAPVVGALALVVLVAGGVRDVRRPLGVLLAERRRPATPARRRLVLDGLVVVVALVAVAALRRRGVVADGSIEPLVVAAPVLVASAVAVVVARLAPLPLRAVEVAARRSGSLALPVGLARATRGGASGNVVVVLLVLGLGVAGFAAAVHRTLVAGHEQAAQERVGAPVRIEAPPLASLDPAWRPPASSDVVAGVTRLPRALLRTDTGSQRVDVLAVDPDRLAALGLDLPDLTWDGLEPAPLLVSTRLDAAGAPGPEDLADVVVDQAVATGRVAAVAPRLLGRDVEDDGPFVVVDRAALEAVTDLPDGVSTRLVATAAVGQAEASALAADPDATVLVRDRVETALRSAPLAAGVRIGYLVAALAALAATATAILVALATVAPTRRREAAVLAALGVRQGGIRRVLLAEVLPVVTAAAVAGAGLAAALSALLADELDLAAFTGTAAATRLLPPAWTVAGLLVAGALAVATAGAILSLGRVDPGRLLREGDA